MWLTKKGYPKHTALDTQTFQKKMTRILTNIEFYKSPQKPNPVMHPGERLRVSTPCCRQNIDF